MTARFACVVATLWLGYFSSVASAEPCKWRVQAPFHVTVEQGAVVREFRLSTTDPAIHLTPHASPEGMAAIAQCSGCFGAKYADVVLKIAPAEAIKRLDTQFDVGIAPETFVTGIGWPADRFRPISQSEDIEFAGLKGALRMFLLRDDKRAGAPSAPLVNFFGANDCVSVIGAVRLFDEQDVGKALAEIRRFAATIDVSEVEVGSTNRMFVRPARPQILPRPRNGPEPPLKLITIDDVQRALRPSKTPEGLSVEVMRRLLEGK